MRSSKEDISDDAFSPYVWEGVYNAVPKLNNEGFIALQRVVWGLENPENYDFGYYINIALKDDIYRPALEGAIRSKEHSELIKDLPWHEAAAVSAGKIQMPEKLKTPEEIEIEQARLRYPRQQELNRWEIARARQKAQERINKVEAQIKKISGFEVKRILKYPGQKSTPSQFSVEIYYEGDFNDTIEIDLDSPERDMQIQSLENKLMNLNGTAKLACREYIAKRVGPLRSILVIDQKHPLKIDTEISK